MHWLPRTALAVTGAGYLAAAQEPQTVLSVTVQRPELPFLEQARDILSRYVDRQGLGGRDTDRSTCVEAPTNSSFPDIRSLTGTSTRRMSSATSENALSTCCQKSQRAWRVMSTFRDCELDESAGARFSLPERFATSSAY